MHDSGRPREEVREGGGIEGRPGMVFDLETKDRLCIERPDR